MKLQRKYIILISFSALLVAIDQVIKMYIHLHYQVGESVPVIPGFFNLTYVRNPGAAFGFLAQSHPNFRETFFLIMPPIALAIILVIMRSVPDNDYLQIFSLSSVFGGAMGNYIDRIQFRYVIDYLDFHWKEVYTWPAFNVADSAIVIGVIILVILMFFEGKATSEKDPAKNAS